MVGIRQVLMPPDHGGEEGNPGSPTSDHCNRTLELESSGPLGPATSKPYGAAYYRFRVV